MAVVQTTTITCDCCGFSFTDASGEVYRTISLPAFNAPTVIKIFCVRKGCDQHVPPVITTVINTQATAHVADVVTQIASPVPSAAAVIGGGTFAAGSQFWKVTALTRAGETNGSAECTATLLLNGSADITWAAVVGATGYKIYRGTAAGVYPSTSLVGTVGLVLTFTDNGTAPIAPSVPTANTSGGIPLKTTPY